MIPMLIGGHGEILLYQETFKAFLKGPVANVQLNMRRTTTAALCTVQVSQTHK